MNTPKKFKKFKMVADNLDLKMYIFSVSVIDTKNMSIKMEIRLVFAYDDVAAVESIRVQYPFGMSLSLSLLKMIDFKKVISFVDLPSPFTEKKQENVVPINAKKKTVNDFVNELMLVSDRFVTSEKDKKTLQRILNKIIT